MTRPPEHPARDAFVALGSNVGDRLAHLRGAVDHLVAAPYAEPVACSRVYETAPVGPAGQGPYLNAVFWLRVRCEAHDLLSLLLAIEVASGRVRKDEVRWGPRVLDLDLLLFADQRICVPGLEVPHPRMAERPFVLEPLCDLVPGWRHPRSGRSFRELAESVRDPAAVRVFAAPLWPTGLGRARRRGREAGGGDRSGEHLARR